MSTSVVVSLSAVGVVQRIDLLKIAQVAQSIKYPIINLTLHSDGTSIPYVNLITDNNVSGDDDESPPIQPTTPR